MSLAGSREALPANGVGGMLIPQKMCSFQEPIAGQNGFVAVPGFEKRGVVADPQRHAAVGLRSEPRSGYCTYQVGLCGLHWALLRYFMELRFRVPRRLVYREIALKAATPALPHR